MSHKSTTNYVNDQDTKVLAEHVRVAGYAKVPLFLVNLTCGKKQEDGERAGNLEEAEHGRDVLRHQNALRRIVWRWCLVDDRKVIGELRGEAGMECFTLDTTSLSVEEAVAKKMRRMDE